MIKEELEKEAGEWLDKKYLKDMGVREPCKQAYIASAEPREKRIEELEEQIEQLKGCHNCRHFAEPYQLCCYSLGDEDYDCCGRKWELKEK